MEGSTSDGAHDAVAACCAPRRRHRVWAAEPPHTLHLTLNVTIDESGPDPSVSSVMLMVTRESPPRVFGSAFVRQVVRRTSDGWRIASREIVAA